MTLAPVKIINPPPQKKVAYSTNFFWLVDSHQIIVNGPKLSIYQPMTLP